MTFVWLFIAGFIASVFGSMVGLGGGFIIVPVLRLFFGLSPATAAGTTLALVIANSASGSTAYLAQRRVDLRTGFLVALGGIPGGILGAIAVKHAPEQIFDVIFSLFLIAVAIDIVLNRHRRDRRSRENAARMAGTRGAMNAPATLGTGFAVGFVSSLLGVGGGVILIPSLLYFSALPAHAISATSQFSILLTSPIGFLTHALQSDVRWSYAVPLAVAGLLGGPVGARLSLRLQSPALLLCVAGALVIAALALLVRHFTG